MAIPAYMWMKDDQGNDIKGSVTVAEREGSIEVIHFDHELRIPTDNDTGELTGTRKHEPFVFTKSIDASSPYMYKACSNGQTLKELVLRWYRIDETGTEKEYFQHKLENVKITSIKPKMHNVKDLDKERYPHLEEVAIRYGKITWNYLEGNIEFSDSWSEGR
ncbi:Hcp family type VI secretion system effector [Pleionea mediterranea]|jgi:type VI secretion system secreted protein Hcp|uniref:Type VI secretion system secreted protein Hcp n=1 Tax=Pleionea mediterranea TaxID=523701 RepID=A0A316FS05_9GAMM|nr:Hcp family type VI secretion system effector [Pleionea mediterranea]PWK42544.1 type VI secretion system secreted protein Hcp [Pleionea mediterranea]